MKEEDETNIKNLTMKMMRVIFFREAQKREGNLSFVNEKMYEEMR